MALLGAVTFGVFAGWFKGDGAGLRSALGNLSAPWLLVAVVPAWSARSWWRGALIGLAGTLLGLLGFYLAATAVTAHRLGFGADHLHAFRFVLSVNRRWLEAGLLSGPVCGAATVALRRLWPQVRLVAVAAVAMVGEFVVVRTISSTPPKALPSIWTWNVGDWRGYDAELVLGLMLLACVAARYLRRSTPPS